MNTMQQQGGGQQMQGQQGQSMLTSKNLTILEDMMNLESLDYKKMNMYSQSCTDPQLKDICNKAAQLLIPDDPDRYSGNIRTAYRFYPDSISA